MSMAADPYSLRDVIAELPRSPCSRMLGRVVGTQLNGPSLKIPAGNRLDTLGERGLEALQAITFGQSALDHIDQFAGGIETSLHDLVRRSSLQLIQHLNTTPRRMKLVVEAAVPSSPEQYATDTKYYEQYRRNYIGWLAKQAKRHPEHFESVAVGPRGYARERTGRHTRDPLPFQMTGRELGIMRRGVLPQGWSVEHIKARCFDIPGVPKNRLDNLILMPADSNAWTAQLEQIQRANLFRANGRNRRQLMICAEPVNGPKEGYFVYGASTPVGMDADELQRTLALELRDIATGPKKSDLKSVVSRRWHSLATAHRV
jgi:hypothetical protein